MNRPAHRAEGLALFTLLAAVAFLGALLFPLQAIAADKTVAVYIEGPDANTVRQSIVAALGDRVQVANTDAFTKRSTSRASAAPSARA